MILVKIQEKLPIYQNVWSMDRRFDAWIDEKGTPHVIKGRMGHSLIEIERLTFHET